MINRFWYIHRSFFVLVEVSSFFGSVVDLIFWLYFFLFLLEHFFQCRLLLIDDCGLLHLFWDNLVFLLLLLILLFITALLFLFLFIVFNLLGRSPLLFLFFFIFLFLFLFYSVQEISDFLRTLNNLNNTNFTCPSMVSCMSLFDEPICLILVSMRVALSV